MGLTVGHVSILITGSIGIGIPTGVLAYKLAKADIVRETIKMLDGRYMKKSDCKRTHDVGNVILKSLRETVEENKSLTRQVLDAVLNKKNTRKKSA